MCLSAMFWHIYRVFQLSFKNMKRIGFLADFKEGYSYKKLFRATPKQLHPSP